METRADPTCSPTHFSAGCPSRVLFEQVADKWSMMVLTVLHGGPLRFNAIRRQLEGVTQKALTQCLRRLERNGLLTRRIIPAAPIGVEYALTDLGRSLHRPFKELYIWMHQNLDEVEAARVRYDEASSAPADAVA
ncbi:MAG: helix-turn-helix domain-containing protein [Luteibacter sp.]|jgi:DNA-binding HxlR family transcriptional regulator|uniref:winged helix-turn-helix transcriptional regulator n=1 Tax=Luteibacter TaxID=242605 RepID=UPI00055E6A23|nr:MULTISPECIES: helix-turn-helix domain-containing protein [unclassified Luteibacter]MDQ7995810.1 helix-turn-helix domain-containing protein [Luteibacter sp.]MDQ8049098.1 helix-turn-helix domain-containing protein [Luteibacter sp.]MDR6642397.1 DNA-binding HxlR family transcriptional regulator [Luteibacter sp. 1214]